MSPEPLVPYDKDQFVLLRTSAPPDIRHGILTTAISPTKLTSNLNFPPGFYAVAKQPKNTPEYEYFPELGMPILPASDLNVGFITLNVLRVMADHVTPLDQPITIVENHLPS